MASSGPAAACAACTTRHSGSDLSRHVAGPHVAQELSPGQRIAAMVPAKARPGCSKRALTDLWCDAGRLL